jgi:phosphoglycolate phosphatase
MIRYRLLIFDFDGTLADSEAWLVAKYNGLAAELGLRRVSEAELQLLRGCTTQEIMKHLDVPMWKLPRIVSRMRAIAAADSAQIKLFAGVDALLPKLKQSGHLLAMVSSNSEDNVRRILGPANVACFDAFDCSASMFGKARKIRAVIKRCGVEPRQTLCIGDEPRDMEAAREVGADAAAVLWGYANAEVLERFKPTLLFRSVEEIAVLAG